MRYAQSVKYRPPREWAAGLRSRALAGMPVRQLNDYLPAFRAHNEVYSERLMDVCDWSEIRPLQKEEIATLPVCTDEQTYVTRSSGTSGIQVAVSNSISERRFRQALAYRPFLFYELDDDVRQLIFVDGAAVEEADKQQWPFDFGGHRFLTWHAGIAAPIEQILALIREVRPDVIRGLSSGIVRFAEEIGTAVTNLNVKIISPSGEHLDPDWRVTMQAAFAAPVLDRYGMTEVGSIGWQCPYCNDYHANSDEIILENDDSGLLATPLFIESQPLLRYQTGDRVVLHEDSHDCRIRLPTLSIVGGRRDDWLLDGAGKKVSPLSFQFEKIAGLQRWRIHQLSSGMLRLYFDAEAGIDLRQQLMSELMAIIPGQHCELVRGTWSMGQRGKYKRVVSDMEFARP